MDYDKNKAKLLKKYMDADQGTKTKRSKQLQGANVLIRDHDDIQLRSNSPQQSQQQNPIAQTSSKTKNQKDTFHQTKIHKKLKRAFGGENDEQIQNFMQSVKIEGMQEQQLNQYLKKNKSVTIEVAKQRKKIKKQKKKKKKKARVSSSEDQNNNDELNSKEQLKKKMFGQDSSSDLQVPQNSRTVFRNKDGTIKEKSDKKMKQQHEQKVLDRLAQWQKGMKHQNHQSDHQSDENVALAKQQVFDDPMRRWDKQQFVKPLQCKYQGYSNRFNIKPGYRWDGVIRGNGFETKYLQQQNLKKLDEDKKNRQYLKNL